MRLSELLGATVVDEHGQRAGKVHDVRLVVTAGDSGIERLEVEGLVLNLGAVGSRLGFNGQDGRGPWPLTALLGRLARRAHYVPWGRVTSVRPGEVRITGTREDLDHPPVLRR